MGVTQKQIAERLNVSRSLVARALQGYDDVSEDTQRRVLGMAREMGYSMGTNQEARSLVAKRYKQSVLQGRIALVTYKWDGDLPHTRPFYGAVLKGMESRAAELGFELCMCPTRAGEVHSLIGERHVDGVILLGYQPEFMDLMRSSDLPVVSFQGSGPRAHSVVQDSYQGIYLVTQHLLELGHRRIVFLGVRETIACELGGHVLPSLLRERAYREAMSDFGIKVPDEWLETSLRVPGDTSMSFCAGCTGCAACMGWNNLVKKNGGLEANGKPPFTAMVCYNDNVAMGAITNAQNAGVQVPDDLSVTGFDDISGLYRFAPEITSIAYKRDEFGEQTVQLLSDILHAGADENNAERHLMVPVALVERDSTRGLK